MTSRSDRSSTSADVGGDAEARVAVERAHRGGWGRLLSLLVTRSRRLDLAEDALSEAFARATRRWPSDGVPANPEGWLYTTAWRLLIGSIRSEASRGRAVQQLALGPNWEVPDGDDETHDLGDERLAVLLLCCHPAVHPDARAPLALRLGIGTSTAEIARLFLVSTPTMAARLTRAKKKIVAAGVPLVRPIQDELGERLHHVCQAIYVAFTAGYTPGSGDDLLRVDLAGEALELAAVLRAVAPERVEAAALHSLLAIQHARRDTRMRDGRLVTLDEQDRSRWHRDEIDAALAVVGQLPPADGYAEELRLQALIAAEHARARAAADTDWSAIAALYADLDARTGSPIVRLNRAVALAEVEGPTAGLALLGDLDDEIGASHRLHAVRAELSRRDGDDAAAQRSYRAAIDRCANGIERQHLLDRLATLPG